MTDDYTETGIDPALPGLGEMYRHYGGGCYTVLGYITWKGNSLPGLPEGAKLIMYQNEKDVSTQPVDRFVEVFENTQTGEQIKRFTKIVLND